jgi:hypothetical protein
MSDVCEHAPGWFAEMVLPSASISPGRETDLLAIEPRPCAWCGLTIDRHDMVDHGEGPEFYCADLSPDEMTLDELERRAELRRQEEAAAIFARLEAMDDPSKRLPPRAGPEPYRPAASTIAAFWYVASLNDADYLKRWLAEHPRDVTALQKLWEAKHARS